MIEQNELKVMNKSLRQLKANWKYREGWWWQSVKKNETTNAFRQIWRSTGVAYNKYSPEFVLPSTYYIYNL